LGLKGFAVYGSGIETVLILCLDITAKAIYGLYLVRTRERLQRAGELAELEAEAMSASS
jgi:bacteriorhodopsin